MPDKVNLYAIHGTTDEWEDEPFDKSKLPATIIPTVTIENVSSMFTEDTFKIVEDRISPDDLKALKDVEYAIVHRYRTTDHYDADTEQLGTGKLVYQIAACLRLIRPMRQFVTRIHGTLRDDGTLDVDGFDHPVHLIEVPIIQKDFRLRNRDIEELQNLAPKYLAALAGEYWKFRMPLSLQDAAHFIDRQWKARMSLACSAIESIYSSQTQDHEHSGSRLMKARIKWFLGESTSIYWPGDVQSFLHGGKEPTIGDVLDDLYDVRNFLAHGDRVPDKYFSQFSHSAGYSATETNQLTVLEEAASFIVRASLIKILKDDLLEHFKGGPESQAYFAKYGLVNSRLARI